MDVGGNRLFSAVAIFVIPEDAGVLLLVVLLCAGNAVWFIGPPLGREGKPSAAAVWLVFLGACALKKLEPDAERCPRAR